MNRLIQGDVGCGKTIVAILVSSLTVGNNRQVAVMAPTEILARQHYLSFKNEFDKVNIPCCLLVGKMKKTERATILKGLKEGKISVVIGTHALIQEDVEFNSLGLVIIDEQHRFGVTQRLKLQEKGDNPHLMSMTATPIPRTLSITYHGDMDLSIIDELPKNRVPVTTKVVDQIKIEKVLLFADIADIALTLKTKGFGKHRGPREGVVTILLFKMLKENQMSYKLVYRYKNYID